MLSAPSVRASTASTAPQAMHTCIISKGQESVSDMLEVALLLKEVGLVDPAGSSAIDIVPLFETIGDLPATAAG